MNSKANRTHGVILASAVALTSFAAVSGTYVWSDGSSWDKPQPGDIVQIPANTTVQAADADVNSINALGGIAFAAATSKIEFDVTGDKSVSVCINGTGASGASSGPYGKIVKNGTGTLRLAATSQYAYHANIDVNNGILQLPVVNSGANMFYQYLTVNSPGILLPPTCSGDGYSTMWGMLAGDGIVSNPTPREVRFYTRASSESAAGTFSGVIYGPLSCLQDGSSKYQNFTGTGSVNTNSIKVSYASMIGIGDFGGVTGSHTNNGSFGTGEFLFNGSGGFRYLGTGGDSYAQFKDASTSISLAILDVAPNAGGLRLHGGFRFGQKYSSRFWLTGDFADECTFDGTFTHWTGGAVYVTKKGTGTWHFKGSRSNNGVFAVENGTLKFDSIADADTACALGSGTKAKPFEDKIVGSSSGSINKVPYAYLLGDGTTTGTMEYTGVTDAYCRDRLFAVKGSGRITSSGGRLVLSGGACGAVAGENTLCLGGSVTGCEMNNITNGVGTVKVVKEGNGTWKLGGDLNFSGGIDVRDGVLELAPCTAYRYYKFTMTERNDITSGENNYMSVGRLGLFNATGGVVNASLVENRAADGNPRALGCGEFALAVEPEAEITTDLIYSGSSFTNLFVFCPGQSIEGASFRTRSGSTNKKSWPSLKESKFWPSIILRLPESTDDITHYDVGSTHATSDSYYKSALGSWKVYGSVDGINWDSLSTVISNKLRGVTLGKKTWCYDGTSYTAAAGWTTHTAGWTIPPRPTGRATEFFTDGLGKVAVSSNATLRAATPLTVNSLVLDPANPNGTLDGFTFAENGTITISGERVRLTGALRIPVTFANATGLSGLSGWTVMSGGRELRCRIVVESDAVTIIPTGLILVVQ